jgi:hypothetical protein
LAQVALVSKRKKKSSLNEQFASGAVTTKLEKIFMMTALVKGEHHIRQYEQTGKPSELRRQMSRNSSADVIDNPGTSMGRKSQAKAM